MATFKLLGTGNAAMCPVYGCECKACSRALEDRHYKRNKTSACLTSNGKNLLIDANHHNLMDIFSKGDIDSILLTHYHMDHVQSLFDLRWSVHNTINVYGPPDIKGCDDLFKHPGILNFDNFLEEFKPFYWEGIKITPLPMIHSKITYGYLFDSGKKKLAYLTDTLNLPTKVISFLKQNKIDFMILDCNFPPAVNQPRNHNNIDIAIDLDNKCNPKLFGITHISHQLDCWLMDEQNYYTNKRRFVAYDEQEFFLND